MKLTKRNQPTKKKYAKKLNKRRKQNKKTKRIYNNKMLGGSKVYKMNGKIESIDDTFEGKPIFRKMTIGKKELEICKIIMQNPHPNIITIYNIYDSPDPKKPSYIDMEQLNTDIQDIPISTIKNTMLPVKNFLQSLGIMYIDWKPDNTGLTTDGQLKLFDFDCSGQIDVNTNEWIIPAPKLMYNYREAVNAGFTTPIDIDNYSFDNAFV